MVGWQEGHLAHKWTCVTSPQRLSSGTSEGRKSSRNLVNPDSPGKRPLQWRWWSFKNGLTVEHVFLCCSIYRWDTETKIWRYESRSLNEKIAACSCARTFTSYVLLIRWQTLQRSTAICMTSGHLHWSVAIFHGEPSSKLSSFSNNSNFATDS